MSVDVIIEDARWTEIGLEALAARAVQATMVHLGLDDEIFEISLLACDDTRIATLNNDFRGKPAATNVLSWPSAARGCATAGEMPVPPDPSEPELGDIAIAFDTCMSEAASSGRNLGDHTTHLIIHGTLHLLGFDHIRDADAALMEALEVDILGKLGLSDPYCL